MLRSARTTRALIVGLIAGVAMIATLLIPAAATATPSGSLRRYPYLTDLVLHGVKVNWATTTSITSSSVSYGRSADESCTAHTVSAHRTAITVDSTPEYQWKASIPGLKRNTSYCYRILGGGADLLGSDPSPVFKSQLPAGSTVSYRFAVIGDWGWQDTSELNTDQANVLSELASGGARFAVSTGDVAYQSGSQTNYGDLVRRARRPARSSGRTTGPSRGPRSPCSTCWGTMG